MRADSLRLSKRISQPQSCLASIFQYNLQTGISATSLFLQLLQEHGCRLICNLYCRLEEGRSRWQNDLQATGTGTPEELGYMTGLTRRVRLSEVLQSTVSTFERKSTETKKTKKKATIFDHGHQSPTLPQTSALLS